MVDEHILEGRRQASMQWAYKRAQREIEQMVQQCVDYFGAYSILEGEYDGRIAASWVEWRFKNCTDLHLEAAKDYGDYLFDQRRKELIARQEKARIALEKERAGEQERTLLERFEALSPVQQRRCVIRSYRKANDQLSIDMRNLYIYWLYDVESEHKTPDPKHVLRRREPQHGKRYQGYGY
tara:strand:+ start:170 stop:712 length:543 start_codon:yes stop_codon:yes gene_type:complete